MDSNMSDVDLKSLPKGVCKVKLSDTAIRISTRTMHFLFDLNGTYKRHYFRKGASIAMNIPYGAYCVGALYLFDASKKTCRELAISILWEVRLAQYPVNEVLLDMC